ncbi:hypothetical protein KP001_18985 [Geomonas subterranea]|uniref:DUF5666 domain-containing protein n=1 Tax=Geomonas subterranea TaxID=2847989 RepID=A0ABX8LHS1_9BACT|nr:hypothetical protein [Geomonas subterranea]QXE90466.1 hypothetical protein KP001_18985 [Geomonas subterranea]QXM11458.1 hypothetical protein KP002_10305 [Geomonas subterranea]
MKVITALMGITLLAATTVYAGPKSYQVTGPVLEVKDDMVVVQKGSEKWQIAKDKDTKITGDVKVGSKVTIMYTMKAASIDAKDGAAKPEKKEKKK